MKEFVALSLVFGMKLESLACLLFFCLFTCKTGRQQGCALVRVYAIGIFPSDVLRWGSSGLVKGGH
jgi:hypothetical protein